MTLTLPDSARGDLLSVSFECVYAWAELSKFLGREATRGSVPASLIGCEPGDILKVSGKTGAGVPELLDRIVDAVPH